MVLVINQSTTRNVSTNFIRSGLIKIVHIIVVHCGQFFGSDRLPCPLVQRLVVELADLESAA